MSEERDDAPRVPSDGVAGPLPVDGDDVVSLPQPGTAGMGLLSLALTVALPILTIAAFASAGGISAAVGLGLGIVLIFVNVLVVAGLRKRRSSWFGWCLGLLIVVGGIHLLLFGFAVGIEGAWQRSLAR